MKDKYPSPRRILARTLLVFALVVMFAAAISTVSAVAQTSQSAARPRFVGTVTSEIDNPNYGADSGTGRSSPLRVRIVANAVFEWNDALRVYKPTGTWSFDFRMIIKDATVTASASGAITPEDGAIAVHYSGRSASSYDGSGMSSTVVQGIMTREGKRSAWPLTITREIPWWGYDVIGGSGTVQPDGSIDGSMPVPSIWGMMKVHWHFDGELLGEEMLDVVIDATGYKTWIPAGGPDEKHAGSYLQVEAKLQRTDGKPPVRRARRFTFALNEVSKEPGICMNWPKRDLALTTPDLAFERDMSRLIVEDSAGQRGRTADGQFISATAIVSAFDYGAYGELTVTAEMDDGEKIEGHVVGQPTQASLLIPRRWAGSKIADAWKESMGVVGLADSDDSEQEPVGDGFAGDGLALYEEYRGLRMEFGQWRTDPKIKDYFVRDELRIGTIEAFTYFDKLTGFAVRRIAKDAHENRVINFNFSPKIASLRRGNQHLVILRRAQSAFDTSVEGAGGYTSAPTSRNGRVTPQDVDYICIFATPGEMKDVVEPGSDGALRTVRSDYYKIAIVHELLHSVNVKHHGAGDRKNAAWSAAADGRTVLENGQAVNVSLEVRDAYSYASMLQLPLTLTVAVQNGAFSGDQTCIMRYANPLTYMYPDNGSDQRVWLGTEPPEALGMLLCANKTGTGVNAPSHPPWPRYGDATMGACRTQMRVSDVEGQ